MFTWLQQFSFDFEEKTGNLTEREQSFWGFDRFFDRFSICEHSANACAMILDFGTRLLDFQSCSDFDLSGELDSVHS